MVAKSKAPANPSQPKSIAVKIKQFGLAVKDGWAWLLIPAFKYLYPLIFFGFLIICIKFCGLDHTILTGLLGSVTKFILKYINKVK